MPIWKVLPANSHLEKKAFSFYRFFQTERDQAMKKRKARRQIQAGIDIGTRQVRLILEDEGIVFDEPCLLAVDQNGQTLAIGKQASQMRGLADEEVRIISPFENGQVNLEALKAYLEQLFLDCQVFRLFYRTVLAVSYPGSLSDEQAGQLKEYLLDLGAERVWFGQEILFSALGSRIDIHAPVASCILNIGHENCEIAVYARGKLKARESFSINGQAVSKQIEGWLIEKNHLRVSDETIQQIKEQLGGFLLSSYPAAMEIRGISLNSLNMETLVIDQNQVASVLAPLLEAWCQWISTFLGSLDQHDLQDIYSRGIIACGGCLQLAGLASALQELCRIPVFCADNPSLTVAAGLQSMLGRISF